MFAARYMKCSVCSGPAQDGGGTPRRGWAVLVAPHEERRQRCSGAVGGLGCCHVHAHHQEAPQGLCVVLGGWRVAVPIWCAGSTQGDGQPESCPVACGYPASGPLSSNTIPGASQRFPGAAGRALLAGSSLGSSEPPCSLLGGRTRFRKCLPAAADICVLSVSRSGKPFRASFASLMGFVFFLLLTSGRDVSQHSTGLAHAAAPQQLLGFSRLFVPTSIPSVCSPAVSVNTELRQLVTHLLPLHK